MPEVSAVVVDDKLNFTGLFNMYDVIRIIEKYFRQKGFDKKIVFDEEYHTEKGMYIHMKLEQYKKMDDYTRQIVRLWIYANDLVDVEKEVDGEVLKLHQGSLSITFDGFLQTDYENRWEVNAVYFFIRGFAEKYVLRGRFKYFENLNRQYIQEIRAELSTYLNMNKYLY